MDYHFLATIVLAFLLLCAVVAMECKEAFTNPLVAVQNMMHPVSISRFMPPPPPERRSVAIH
jgi:hypothetical protein